MEVLFYYIYTRNCSHRKTKFYLRGVRENRDVHYSLNREFARARGRSRVKSSPQRPRRSWTGSRKDAVKTLLSIGSRKPYPDPCKNRSSGIDHEISSQFHWTLDLVLWRWRLYLWPRSHSNWSSGSFAGDSSRFALTKRLRFLFIFWYRDTFELENLCLRMKKLTRNLRTKM